MTHASPSRRPALLAAVLGTVSFSWAASPKTVEIPSAVSLAVTVETIDDEIEGRLTQLDQSAGVTLGGDTRLPIADVLSIRFEQRRPQLSSNSAGRLTLTDGSVLPYRTCDIDQETLHLQLVGPSTASIQLASVVSWRVGELAGSEPNSNTPPTTTDILLVKRRNGTSLTPVEGVVLRVSQESVRFVIGNEGDSEPVEVPWSRLGGLRFFRNPPSDQPAARINLSNGGRLATRDLSLDKDGLAWSSSNGGGRLAIEAIDTIDLAAGRIRPVAELRLLNHSWEPSFGEAREDEGYAINRSFGGKRLALRAVDPRVPSGWPRLSTTREFVSGIALKSRGELSFALPTDSRRLKGLVGLDPATVRAGSAEVSILAGERKIWSGVVDGTTRPVKINAAIDGEPTLTLRVDYGDNLDSGDHVHFADLRVIQ